MQNLYDSVASNRAWTNYLLCMATQFATRIKIGLFTLLARDVTCISWNYHNIIPENLILLSRNRTTRKTNFYLL